jgi:hypothetical protein
MEDQKYVAAGIALEKFARPGGFDFRIGGSKPIFCGSPHPEDRFVWCRRFKRHDGDCAAFRFSISVPETWPRPEVEDAG